MLLREPLHHPSSPPGLPSPPALVSTNVPPALHKANPPQPWLHILTGIGTWPAATPFHSDLLQWTKHFHIRPSRLSCPSLQVRHVPLLNEPLALLSYLPRLTSNFTDVIPFPVNDPPTPPTTLTPDQQAAGRKAVAILNEEIKGPVSTARHLEHTLRELRGLLGDACEMTEL